LPRAADRGRGCSRCGPTLVRFLRSAAAARPLLLVLDDLHAADEPSLLLLRFVAGELGGSRILVIGTYRDVDPTVRDPLASTLAELSREHVTHRMELPGLKEGDIAHYFELSAGAAAPAELIAAIHAETEGNPLFVGEVVRLLTAEGRLHFEDALEMNARMGARPWLAHTQRDYARMLLARDGSGDRERAYALLDHALATTVCSPSKTQTPPPLKVEVRSANAG